MLMWVIVAIVVLYGAPVLLLWLLEQRKWLGIVWRKLRSLVPLFGGAGGEEDEEDEKLVGNVGSYTFAVRGDGEVVDPDAKHRVMTSDEVDERLAEIRDKLSAGPAAEKKRVLVFIHGGLQPLASSREKALGRYKRLTGARYRPIFVNWESGPLATYRDHLFLIRAGRRQRSLALLTYPYVFLADVARGVAAMPSSVFRRLYSYLFRPTGKGVRELNGGLELRFSRRDRPSIETSIGENTRSAKWRLGGLIGWLPSRLVSVIFGVFVEGPGTAAWQNMQRRTTTIIRRPEEFDFTQRTKGIKGDRSTTVAAALDAHPSGGVAKLMDALCELTSDPVTNPTSGKHERTPGTGYEITLIGHSMGAIVADEILLQHPHLPIKNIVYMGAASSIRDCFQAVLPFIDGQQPEEQATFYNLCLHPEAERRELNMLDLLPRGSLLEWIDDMFESPRAFVDRRVGKWENILQATHMIPHHLRGQVKIKAFGVGPEAVKARDPQKHGEFDNKAFWERQYWEPAAAVGTSVALRAAVVEETMGPVEPAAAEEEAVTAGDPE